MDDLITEMIKGAPNVIVAIGVLVWCARALERQQAFTERLIERLMALLEENDQLKAQLKSTRQEETD